MRRAKSYSIVDHQLLHAGHLHRLSHQALSLYLFFVVVGDQDGKSFYSERKIMGLLRLSGEQYQSALMELIKSNLVKFCCPNYWVTSFPEQRYKKKTNLKLKELNAHRQGDLQSANEFFKKMILRM
jgi:hypothetical protein